MKYFVVDAFTDEMFKGNPAGVCILTNWLEDELLQNIAAENNLAETAFIVKNEKNYNLRWFTPKTEIDLCGHATLASAFIIMNYLDKNNGIISFNTKSGILTVKNKTELYELDFPSRKTNKVEINQTVQSAINTKIKEAYLSRDLLLLIDSEEELKNLGINMDLLKTVTVCHGFIVTALSSNKEYDFVSRYFAPNVGVNEDHVTGSSHTTLIPFWSERLNKNKLIARQLSKRSGTLYCENNGDRVKISGKAKLYLEGEIKI
jgi:PhzF family phenazine biosynthesis protein